jgi:hypothetical protein
MNRETFSCGTLCADDISAQVHVSEKVHYRMLDTSRDICFLCCYETPLWTFLSAYTFMIFNSSVYFLMT